MDGTGSFPWTRSTSRRSIQTRGLSRLGRRNGSCVHGGMRMGTRTWTVRASRPSSTGRGLRWRRTRGRFVSFPPPASFLLPRQPSSTSDGASCLHTTPQKREWRTPTPPPSPSNRPGRTERAHRLFPRSDPIRSDGPHSLVPDAFPRMRHDRRHARAGRTSGAVVAVPTQLHVRLSPGSPG